MSADLQLQVFHNVSDFALDDIFDCGQCFRWSKEKDGSYSGIVEGSFVNISYTPYNTRGGGAVGIWSDLLIDSPSRRTAFWKNYLDLDRDYGSIKRLLMTEDSVMAKAIKESPGIRILNQNKWETLSSFIISQNNNIPRIKTGIEALCTKFGNKIGVLKGAPIYAFPTLQRMKTLKESDLESCKLGYRAKYLVEVARQVGYDGGAFLQSGEKLSTERLQEYLLNLSGVGPKVANCVMLFSMKKVEVFPIDVWVRRVMSRFYGMGEDNVSAMIDYAERNFQQYGGIAQQYLFTYIRKVQKTNPALYERLNIGENFNSESDSDWPTPAIKREKPLSLNTNFKKPNKPNDPEK